MRLQLLAVRQAGQEVVLGHAQQARFGLVAQVGIALDGFEQLVGGVYPLPQFVAFMTLELRDLVLAGAVRVDRGQVLDHPRQRFGQHPVIHQVQHQPHGQGAQYARDKDDDRADQETSAIGGGVEGDTQVAVIFAVGALAHQRSGKGAFLTKNQVGQPAAWGLL